MSDFRYPLSTPIPTPSSISTRYHTYTIPTAYLPHTNQNQPKPTHSPRWKWPSFCDIMPPLPSYRWYQKGRTKHIKSIRTKRSHCITNNLVKNTTMVVRYVLVFVYFWWSLLGICCPILLCSIANLNPSSSLSAEEKYLSNLIVASFGLLGIRSQ